MPWLELEIAILERISVPLALQHHHVIVAEA